MEMKTQQLKEFLFDFDNDSPFSKNEKLNQELIFTESLWKNLQHNFQHETLEGFFKGLPEEERELYFKFGIECILNFIQINFTGPTIVQQLDEFLNKTCADFDYKSRLSVDNEDINVNTKHAVLLCAASAIFKHCEYTSLNCWWQWRALMIHQQILDDLSPKLLAEVEELHKKLLDLNLESHFQALLELEQVQLYQIYRDIPKSELHLKNARELLGVKHDLVGALGRRTKYQQNDVAQLQLIVSIGENTTRCDVREFTVAKNLALEDDVRLDTVQFKAAPNLPMLTDLEQKFLVLSVRQLIISQPRDNLYYEEIKPYLDYLLHQRNTWAVRAVVLLIRCKLESSHKRTIERCLLQCEEVMQCVGREEPQFYNRLTGVFCTHFLPIWKIEEQLAELMLNTGLIKASLDIYLRLKLWEEVIVCYTLLKLRHKATEIIKEQLEVNPTVKLWCLLGDSTDDVDCYQTAWEMSRHRSSRAQRHWGEYLYYRKQYMAAIPHFEESLRINPLQVEVWLHYGFAALEMENWQCAATAYKRYTTLEPGNFQAWNNLAKTYIKLGHKRAAHQALHDAIKCNFDNWKVWDNLMVVSVDVNAFSDVINAYHRILDLKGSHVDPEVLQALVSHVTCSTKEPNLLLRRTQELFGRLTSICPLHGILWELYADLATDVTTVAQRLQRAHRGYTQTGWEKDIGQCKEVLRLCDKLGECALNNEIKSSDLIVSNARLSLTSSLSAIKKQQFNEPLDVDNLSSLVQQVTEKCRTAHSSS
ncbi:hypothetical protein PPYR_10199 [Photinus pyralis]|uniref:Uncharacterized protein n=1 Tax=Photinus pyralis TaxID=7054 RepID=A0A1Y1LCX3_PHOPY|nr:tetratricopeptide repeat protein 27 [Photinus pyralis]KAB0796138.1 hypothetical protein PPYR_10199 [Photinus pyralis]